MKFQKNLFIWSLALTFCGGADCGAGKMQSDLHPYLLLFNEPGGYHVTASSIFGYAEAFDFNAAVPQPTFEGTSTSLGGP